jgi:hypothetical protein
VRAPVVLETTLFDVDSEAAPPPTTLHMRLRDRETRFDGTWTLALDGPDDAPWRVAAVLDDQAAAPSRAAGS